MIIKSFGFLCLLTCMSFFAVDTLAQKVKVVAKPAKTVVFGIVSDGGLIEPIAYINKGKLEPPANGSDEGSLIKAFNKTYYKPGTSYRLIFGGANTGSVVVKAANAGAECSKNVGTVATKTTGTPLKGLIMGLATNAAVKSATPVRRKPTATEKTEMDALAKAEFAKEKLTPKVLRFQNLTAVDVNNDGKAEFVGSYWVEVDKLTRALLFFIASQGSNGKYTIGYKEYRSVDQASVMSGAIKDVDDGVYHELLLDSLDTDGDGVNEIFTYTQSFEGAGFNVYRQDGGKWEKAYEFSNYHCAY